MRKTSFFAQAAADAASIHSDTFAVDFDVEDPVPVRHEARVCLSHF
jgi:hypothetical protein